MEGDLIHMSAIAQTFTDTAVLDLDALRRLTYDELDTLYRAARCPNVISELNADTRGAMPRVALSADWPNRVVAAHLWRIVRVSVGRQIV
jgi:hypothetical protein